MPHRIDIELPVERDYDYTPEYYHRLAIARNAQNIQLYIKFINAEDRKGGNNDFLQQQIDHLWKHGQVLEDELPSILQDAKRYRIKNKLRNMVGKCG